LRFIIGRVKPEVEKSEESDLPCWRGFGVSSSIRDTPVDSILT